VPSVNEASMIAIQAVQRELEQFEEDDAAVAAGLSRRSARYAPGRSICYSIRLDQGEVAALERRAAAVGLKPTVLARNLIRTGLGAGDSGEAGRVVDRLEAAVQELRALVG
jgi:hypothetical protein